MKKKADQIIDGDKIGNFMLLIDDTRDGRSPDPPWFIAEYNAVPLERAVREWEWESTERVAAHHNPYGSEGVTTCSLFQTKRKRDGTIWLSARTEPIRVKEVREEEEDE